MPDFRSLQYAFAAHLRDPVHAPPPPGVEDRRMGVYRDLFFGNVHGFMRTAFPVLVRTLGDDHFERLVREWFAEYRARSPLFPAMPREFVDYLTIAREPRDDDPPWLGELAHYEWVELALELDEAELGESGGDPLDGVPALSPLAWNLAYAFPVHRIGPGFQPDAPGDTPTLLVVYRGRDDRVGFMVVNPVTWRLLELIEEARHATGRELLARIAGEIGADHGTILVHGRDTLGQLHARDIIVVEQEMNR